MTAPGEQYATVDRVPVPASGVIQDYTTVWHVPVPGPGVIYAVKSADWTDDYTVLHVRGIEILQTDHIAGAAVRPKPSPADRARRLADLWAVEADAAQLSGTAKGRIIARTLRACAAELRDEVCNG
jgi:hypothetical protein